MTTVTIGPLTLKQLPPGADRTGFVFKSITDWRSIPESKAKPTPRPQGHGSFSGGRDWRESAAPSVIGHYWGASEADAILAMEELDALAGGSKVIMAVTDPVRTTWREVSVRSISIPDHDGQDNFEFQIAALADDPLRYGTTVAVSTGLAVAGGGLTWPLTWPITWVGGGSDGRLTAVNPGKAETFPILEVSGGLTGGFSIVEVGSGRQIRFERLIPEGSTVFISPKTGRAWIDAPANDVSGFLTHSDWWAVPAGGTSTMQFSALGSVAGTPTFTARTAPAFW